MPFNAVVNSINNQQIPIVAGLAPTIGGNKGHMVIIGGVDSNSLLYIFDPMKTSDSPPMPYKVSYQQFISPYGNQWYWVNSWK